MKFECFPPLKKKKKILESHLIMLLNQKLLNMVLFWHEIWDLNLLIFKPMLTKDGVYAPHLASLIDD